MINEAEQCGTNVFIEIKSVDNFPNTLFQSSHKENGENELTWWH